MKARLFAECFGTFVLVFCGTGAILINDISGGAISHVGIALTFGLVVMAMIYSVGEVSGAHINPAVSIGFWIARRFSSTELIGYVLSQCAGAILASAALAAIFPGQQNLGATLPAGGAAQSFVLELILTLILMFVILSVASGSKEQGIMAGTAIGATVCLEALFAGPISGASMNPARSLGPALISGQLDALWIYLLAPILGAAGAVLCCRAIHGPDCCFPPCRKLATQAAGN